MDAGVITDPASSDKLAALLAALHHGDPAIRLAAAHALREAGPPGLTAVCAALDHANPQQRETLVRTLVVLGAVERVEELRSDPELGAVAEQALAARRAAEPHWDRWAERVGPWFLLVGLLLGIGNELLTWFGFVAFARGVSQQIAIGWALIGAYGGAVCGARWGRSGLLFGTKQLGIIGAIAGAAVGKLLADILTPILLALGR